MRANVVPGLILQAFAFVLVFGYYEWPAWTKALGAVGHVKATYGYAYSSLSTAFFAGLVPYLVLRASGRANQRRPLQELGWFLAFWLYRGMEVDFLYRCQALWFGEEATASVIARKVLVDQFIYNPIWAAPTQALFFLWKDSDFSFEVVRQKLGQKSLFERSLLVMVSTWVVWVPAVAIIYSLPSPLQVPLGNLVSCFWTLLLSFVSKEAAEASVPAPPVAPEAP